jgi:replication factor C large subunit
MNDSTPWTRKHQPKNCKEVIGQDSGIKLLKGFISGYSRQKKKVMLIYGAAGSGKTCAVYAVAADLGLEVLEINASDVRNQENINSVLGSALKQQSLFSKGKIVLVDELDGIAGREDRGGVAALAKLIADSAFPVIITANNPFDRKFSSLRKKSELLEFKKLNYKEVHSSLSSICKQEGIKSSDEALNALAARAAGDLRGAINDLQLLTQETRKLSKEDIEALSERNKEEKITNALLKIFKNSDIKTAVEAFSNVNEDINQCMLWIDENLPLEYSNPEDLAKAYEALSKADVFNGRIRRRQHWRFLVYVNDLLTAGVAVAKQQKNNKFVPYRPTSRILKLYIANMRFMKRKAIAQKIAEKTHSSHKEIIKSTLPYLKIVFRHNKKAAEQITDEFELDKEEVAWLKK